MPISQKAISGDETEKCCALPNRTKGNPIPFIRLFDFQLTQNVPTIKFPKLDSSHRKDIRKINVDCIVCRKVSFGTTRLSISKGAINNITHTTTFSHGTQMIEDGPGRFTNTQYY